MERKFKTKSGKRSQLICIAIGTGVGMVLSILLAILATALISNEKLPEASIGYMGIGIIVVSVFAGVQVAGRLSEDQKLLVGAMTALVYYLLLLSITTLLFDIALIDITTNIIALICSCGASILLLIKPTKKHFKRRQIKFSR